MNGAYGRWWHSLLLAAGLWVVILAGADSALFRSGLAFRRWPEIASEAPFRAGGRLKLVAAAPAATVFLGASRAMMGFRPAWFDRLLPEDPTRHSFNLAVDGSPAFVWYLLLRHYLHDTPVMPRRVVIGLAPGDLTYPVDSFHPSDVYPLLQWPSDVAPRDVGLLTWADTGVGRFWRLWGYRTILNEIVHQKVQTLVDRHRAAKPAGTFAPVVNAPDPGREQDVAQGFLPGAGPADLSGNGIDWHWEQGVRPAQDPFLKRMVDVCHDHGVAVVIVRLPVFGKRGQQALSRDVNAYLGGLYADEFLDLSGACQQSRWWRDVEHLNPQGASTLTRTLVDALQRRGGRSPTPQKRA